MIFYRYTVITRDDIHRAAAQTINDVLKLATGCSGLYCALNLPRDKRILMITSSDAESSDSYLAQGGMCMLKDDSDYDSYFEDTLKAGHYENDKKSVEIMIRSSRDVGVVWQTE